VTIHRTDDDSILCFSKRDNSDDGECTVIVVVNLDPHSTRETVVHLDLPALGLGWQDSFLVHDEISDETWTWSETNYVRLDPSVEPAHILTVRRSPR
jgi:starch synthase (maltosyl-transferring)